MTTTPTLLDGLLDDDLPTTMPTLPPVTVEPAAEAILAALANPDDETVPITAVLSEAVSPDATEKLVIVEGQRFLVAAGIDNETIRQHLIRQGFANLAGAEIRSGTVQHDGRTLATVDFIKKAGTKG